jgi:hypothetical protein
MIRSESQLTQNTDGKMINDKFCDLIKKFSPEFIKMIDDTKNDGRERGTKFCSTNGEIALSDTCIGDECHIPAHAEAILECKDKRPTIGMLHTHPGFGERHGNLSEDDIMHAVGNGTKYNCIGYRGLDKMVRCYESPFGIPQEEADKFRNTNIMLREKKLRNDKEKYGINIFENVFLPKTDTSSEQWKKIKEEVNSLTEIKNNLKKYINIPEAEKERLKNSCAIILAPLENP